ncbi:MAG TPA: hypothetical protein VK603_07600 [Candidatus Saccharimonadales bacterium]|nr:hypothetical protein [Candidatus Saccharimonadales bacterium]
MRALLVVVIRERRGTEIWYEFIRLYYKLLPAFTHFIKSKKHRIEVLRLLQGEVFDLRRCRFRRDAEVYPHCRDDTRSRIRRRAF